MMRRWWRKFHPNFQKAVLALIILGVFGAGTFFVWIATFKIPDFSSFENRVISQSTKIYDRTGKILLYDIHNNVKRTVVQYGDISKNLVSATIAIEDSDFWNHHGVKFTSIARAILANLFSISFSQGGSTITQQVIKNSLLSSDKSVSRKIKEWVLALKLETVMSKESIISIYLNEAPYGGNIYGIEEASQSYFGKKSAELDLAESAYLAAIPNSPTYYSPYGNHRDALDARKNLVLKKMLEQKLIADADYASASAEKVSFLPQENKGINAAHFVMFVKQLLEDKYGADMVENGGLKVITSLDFSLQKQAEEVVKKYALENAVNFNASNAAIVAIDPRTGQILAMVGSRDYFDKTIDGNFNVAIAHRQPGSSFKPFAYATAFEKGYTPDTMLFDVQTEFSTECNPDGTPIDAIDPAAAQKCYMPENYDGVYRGPISMRNALAGSINVPAIETLYLAGEQNVLRTAQDMGITSLNTDVNQYGLTLVLGGGEVSLLDMTSAYSVFANQGARNKYAAILSVQDSSGNVIDQFAPNPTKVLEPNIALTISDILNDEVARQPEFGVHSALYFDGRDVAVKTGTTNDYKDAWIIGYTPSIAVGAWAGNNDGTPMEKKIAGFIVAPLWHAFMAEALQTVPDEKFPKPDLSIDPSVHPLLRGFWQGDKSYFVEKNSGLLATQLTPPELKVEKVVKQVHTTLYWIDKDNPRAPKIYPPENDSQFKNWEYAVKKWATDNNIADETDAVIPTATDPYHKQEYIPQVKILSPIAGASFGNSGFVPVKISYTSRFPISKADYYVNGAYIGTSNYSPFNFSFSVSDLSNIQPANELKIDVYDTYSNKGEAIMMFNVSGN